MPYIDTNEIYKKRTKSLSLKIIKLCEDIPYRRASNNIVNQLLRSSTSVTANYRAYCRARSIKERYSKLCTVVEEADETCLWLEFLIEAGYVKREETKDIYNEATAIMKIMSSFRSKIRQQL